jgi:hypothetical protein
MAQIHFVIPWKAAAPMLSLERSPSVHWLLLPQLIIPATRCEWLSSTCSKRVVDAVAKYFIKRLLQTEPRKCNCDGLIRHFSRHHGLPRRSNRGARVCAFFSAKRRKWDKAPCRNKRPQRRTRKYPKYGASSPPRTDGRASSREKPQLRRSARISATDPPSHWSNYQPAAVVHLPEIRSVAE